MDNRKYNCKKEGGKKELIVCTLALLHNKCIIMPKLQLSNQPMLWQFIRKYTPSNYTIYKVNYSKDHACGASLNDRTTTGNTMLTRSVKKAPTASNPEQCAHSSVAIFKQVWRCFLRKT